MRQRKEPGILGRFSLNVGFVMLATILVLAISAFAAACESEGTSQEEPTVRATPRPQGDPEAEPDPEADPQPEVAPGVVETPPPGVPQVKVTLAEWVIARDVGTVRSGETYFLADNVGPDDAHEVVVIKTDLVPGKLPVEDGVVPADKIDIVGAVAPFRPFSQASLTLDLEPGNYALICNIAEVENGMLESHYQLGMFTPFTVED